MRSAPNQSLAGCIMNNPSRLPARDSVADNGECQEQQCACLQLRAADLPIIFLLGGIAVHEERG
jgi:hypothetical protein